MKHPDLWSGATVPDAPEMRPTVMDEFKCLNLNLTIPKSALDNPSEAKLPVLIYIHGGAFVTGAATLQVGGREIFDPASLVRHSQKIERPIIVVTINYRLGPLGFMASKELEGVNRSHGEAFGNYGLHDQRNAIAWVSEFIGGFGGDAENIMLEGGSAGGASCHFQSMFRDRKFQRAICNSGTVLVLAALPVESHQETFDRYVAKFAGGSQEPVARLQSVTVDEFVAEFNLPFAVPVIDHDWIRGRYLGSYVDDCTDPPELIIGASAYEVGIAIITQVFAPADASNSKISPKLSWVLSHAKTRLF